MLEPVLVNILLKTFTYGACGSLAAVVVRFLDRSKSGPRLDHAAAIGFLIGAGFGAFFGIFQSMLVRS
jgi:hypothetical protein